MNTESTGKIQIELWSRIIDNMSSGGALHMAMRHAAYSLKDMVNRPIKVNSLRIETVHIRQLDTYAANLEKDVVGVHLFTKDDLPGQAILILSIDDAMYLADWLLEARPGTTTKLGPLEYSALAETGNVVLSSFLNALAQFSSTSLQPSPPTVMVDSPAALLEVAAASLTEPTEELLIIKTDFINVESSLLIQFWLLPNLAALSLDQVKMS